MQPRNPLWHELAVIRLQQHQPASPKIRRSQISLPGKSAVTHGLAIIAQARRAGDLAGAEQAERNAGN